MDETDLLPFDKIRAIFEKMVTIVGNNVDFNSVFDASGGVEYHITEVRLGLVSISEHNSDNILLVPAWDFLGYERGRISADVNWGTRSTNKLEPFLTINAIDGSIIDRSLGY